MIRLLALVVTSLLLAGCGATTAEEEADVDPMRLEQAASSLREHVDRAAAGTGRVLEVRRDTDASCQLSGETTSRRHDYSVAVRTGPDAAARVRDEVVPALVADGWGLTSSPEQAPAYRLERDGYTLGWLFSRSGGTTAVVQGSTPCLPSH